MKPSAFLLISLGVFGYASSSSQRSAAPRAAKVDFGRDVKPILSEHCFKCHGPDAATVAAGLRLDSFAGATAARKSGPAIVPGDPSGSRLMKRVASPVEEMRMPPPDSGLKPLTAGEIATLRQWIRQGAGYAKHWSFVPPKLPRIPTVSNPAWCRNDIDRFVMAKLDKSGMAPEEEAPRDTLAMRASLTLTGLPPSLSELQTYLADRRPHAYERYVDRLLAKPEYGEHQARYWMDAVRYGDTHGLQLDNERGVYPYRDWVVRAFNRDLPFDQFTQWQLAGDLLPNPSTEQLVATGYVRMNLTTNEGGAIEDEFLARNTFDRVDTTSTVFLGLTVGCAKCHDHKFDPIKQRDYYGLYAFFNSTQDKPLDGNVTYPPPAIPAPTPEQAARLADIERRREAVVAKTDAAEATEWVRKNAPNDLEARGWEISPVYGAASFDEAFEKPFPGEPGQPDAVWKPLKYEPGKDLPNLIGRDYASVYVRATLRTSQAHSQTLRISSDDAVRVWLNGQLVHSHKIGRGLDQGVDDVHVDLPAGESILIVKVVNGVSQDGLNVRLRSAEEQRIWEARAGLTAGDSKAAMRNVKLCYLDLGPLTQPATLFRKLTEEKKSLEASLPMSLIAREMEMPRPTHLLKRGEYSQPGELVQRHLPPVLGSLPKGAPLNRLGLAKWLTSIENPLVSRVFVNRLWQQHFGTGIVKTVEDFGSQGEWPENQELLDYLAVKFVKEGWSVKKLNRLIVTSAAFRQSSRLTSVKRAKDPENRLISRGPRYRLDAEVIRDRALAASGLLVHQLGGHGFKPYQPDGIWEGASDPASSTHIYVRDRDRSIYRRSLYMFWKRTSPPPLMTTFDAPLRDSCVVRRSQTNTPLQALAAMNETAFLEASRVMAERVVSAKATDADRLRYAYRLAFGRLPDAWETTVLLRSLARYRDQYARNPDAAKKLLSIGDWPLSKSTPPDAQAAWMIVCSSLMNTNEFVTTR